MEDSNLYPGASVVRPRGGRSPWPSIVGFAMMTFIWMALWQPDASALFEMRNACVTMLSLR